MRAEKEIEAKNIISAIANKFIKVFSIGEFRSKISGFIKKKFRQGLDESEVEFNMNFLDSEADTNFLESYVNNNMDDVTDALGDQLRGELSRGIMNKESIPKLKKRIKNVFGDKKYLNRFKTVLRTEGMRAKNMGQLDGAKQASSAGVKVKKYIDVSLPRGCPNCSVICDVAYKKYGSPEQAIGLDKEFIIVAKQGNKIVNVRDQAPPFHPNCKSVLVFERVKG